MIDLRAYAGDPAFPAGTFVVIDFEGSTPKDHPPEPIEFGVVVLRPAGSLLAKVNRFSVLMRPPVHAPVTDRRAGITAAMVADRSPAGIVLALLDAVLREPPYVAVAHHASTEANILVRYAAACPTLAWAPMLCTRRLAQYVYPGLASYSLDALLTRTGIPVSAGRHRALPDALVTAVLLQRLLTDGVARHGWSRLSRLWQLASLPRPAARPPKTPCSDHHCLHAPEETTLSARANPSRPTPPQHPVDVFLLLHDGDRVLLALRDGTGYADHLWNLPSGKMEYDEHVLTAIRREAAEEIGIQFEQDELLFVGVVHHRNDWHGRIGLVFSVAYDPERHGEPVNQEPHKCAEIRWTPTAAIPTNTYPYTVAAITAWRTGTLLQLSGWQ